MINGSLQTVDLSKKAKKTLKGNRGPAGLPGAQGAKGDSGPPGPTQFARVRSSGQLDSGTALSSLRFSNGVYVVVFPAAIDRCAATVNSALFAGFDTSAYGVWGHVAIGYTPTGLVEPRTVSVNLQTDTGSINTSFSLVLACP